MSERPARHWLQMAARAALRAAGDVEPNPMVGCVIVRGGRLLGIGHHKKYGGLHAEREALADCARRGEDPRGATAFVTLEPCCHHGKQPPCTDALIAAGIARVVAARPDPNPVSAGGAQILATAGVSCSFDDSSVLATGLAAPFIKRVTTGFPWVIAKWAQTVDGRVATRPPEAESKWISNERSRRQVHRLRARVDAILTGIGTVAADNPLLTARGVARIRRIARRVVVDPRLEISLESALVRSAAAPGGAPLTIAGCTDAVNLRASHAAALREAGAEVLAMSASGRPGEVDLHALLRHLASVHNATNVMTECGPGLLGRLLDQDLVDECRVFIAPMILGDELSLPAAAGRVAPRLTNARRFVCRRVSSVGGDMELWLRRPESA